MKKQKEKEYNFSVFDNYKCDGQYTMQFNNDTVEIKEEERDYKDININDLKII